MRSVTPSFPPTWQIPDASYLVSFERTTPYCVVIPVLDEGERIRQQLERMRALDVFLRSDVVLVDGGSTDGSVEPRSLEALGVRALVRLLEKPGLGRQLRAGYGFALTEGYDGIVTTSSPFG